MCSIYQKMRESRKPKWLRMYEGLINDLRCPLRRFEDGKLDFKQFIDEVNNVLERHGYNRITVIIARRSRLRYAWYKKNKVYISNDVLMMDRRLLGRVFMHEVMHHVLITKPPSSHPRLIRAGLISASLIFFAGFVSFIILLLFIVSNTTINPLLALSTMFLLMIGPTTFLTLDTATKFNIGHKEPIVNALVAYMITRKWLSVKGIKGIEKLEWAGENNCGNEV